MSENNSALREKRRQREGSVMRYTITGATGRLGTEVMKVALEKLPPDSLRVSVRNPEKARHLADKGVEVKKADYLGERNSSRPLKRPMSLSTFRVSFIPVMTGCGDRECGPCG
ncbi:MAG: hypothetical protein U5K84_01750 [Alkalibacterium sp.]|nr:hypothetical protein [Alkalibacterium sp.]